jgi:YqaJ-like viral recombinase domain
MNTPQIFTCAQNTPEWFRARHGIPTASMFATVMAKGKTAGSESLTRRTYLMKLAGEIITGEPMDSFSNEHTERGHEFEPEARDFYAFQTGAPLERVGFVRNGRAGCSPDCLIGDHGGVEIKTKLPHLLIDLILKDEFPSEHKAQVQGTLWVTGRKWWDIAVYWPGIPLFVKRVERDDVYIAQIETEVSRFNTDLDSIVAQMRQRMNNHSLPDQAAA